MKQLVVILAGAVLYGTVTFKKNKGFKILVVLPLKMKTKPNCTPPPFVLPLAHHLIMEVCQPPLDFMGEH